MKKVSTEYDTYAPFIVSTRRADGTVKFERVDAVDSYDGLVKCADENRQLVYVRKEYADLYRTYVACLIGEHHFYDGALVNKLRNLEFKANSADNDPTRKREQAANHYMQAAECMAESSRLEDVQRQFAEEIADIRARMEQADRDGFTELFGGDDNE